MAGRKKYIMAAVLLLLLVAAIIVILFSCRRAGPQTEEYDGYRLYYVNSEQTKVISVPYVSDTEDPEMLAGEFIRALANGSEASDHMPLLGEEVEFYSFKIEGEQLTLNLAGTYKNLSAVEEILIRAALVRTFTQLKGIRFVTLTLDGEPLTDSLGLPVGAMEEDSFIENAGNEINVFPQVIVLFKRLINLIQAFRANIRCHIHEGCFLIFPAFCHHSFYIIEFMRLDIIMHMWYIPNDKGYDDCKEEKHTG